MYKNIAIFLFFCLIGFSGLAQTQENIFDSYKAMVIAAKAEIDTISVSDFYKLYSKALETGNVEFTLIDIRTKDEYEVGFIPGAFLVQRGVLESRLEKEEVWVELNHSKPKKSEIIILYCRSGSRSALAAKSLMMLGYSNVKSLEGGWSVWSEKYPNLVKLH